MAFTGKVNVFFIWLQTLVAEIFSFPALDAHWWIDCADPSREMMVLFLDQGEAFSSITQIIYLPNVLRIDCLILFNNFAGCMF